MSCARRVRISFARWSASIRWMRDARAPPSASAGCWWPAASAASLHTETRRGKAEIARIRLDLDLSSRSVSGWLTVLAVFAALFGPVDTLAASARRRPRVFASKSCSSCRDPRARGRVAEALGPDRDERRARVEQVARVAAASGRRPCRRRDRDARRRPRATCASATARTAGPDRPPVPPPSHGAAAARRGCERQRAQRVDQRDGVGAGGLARPRATAATSAAFGVSFTISGLRGQRPHARRPPRRARAGSAPMSRPVLTFGHETLSSSAAISGARGDRLDERGDLVGGRAHDVRDQRHRQLARARGRSCSR